MAAAQDLFTPASLSVKQLFNNSDSLYQIPRYQRPYKWGDEQIDTSSLLNARKKIIDPVNL
jgi:hypothetical protein